MERRVRLNHRPKLAIALLAIGVFAGAGAEAAEGAAKACVTDLDRVIATKPTDASQATGVTASAGHAVLPLVSQPGCC